MNANFSTAGPPVPRKINCMVIVAGGKGNRWQA